MGNVATMSWTYSDDYYREYTRTTWNESAATYGPLLDLLGPFRTALVERLAPRPGERVVDLGTGPGEPAMTIARAVAPGGRVLGVDLSEKMVALATEVARTRRLDNVEFRTMDCTKLDLEDASFDAAVSAFGFQIFTDPEGAAKEARRILRPSGRIAVTVWTSAKKVPFLDAVIGPMLKYAEPDANGYIPTPYETGGPGEMVGFLEAAGFRDGKEAPVEATMHFASAEEYLRIILKGTPLGHSLSEESPEVQADVLAATRKNLAAATGPGGVDLAAECLVVSARV